MACVTRGYPRVRLSAPAGRPVPDRGKPMGRPRYGRQCMGVDTIARYAVSVRGRRWPQRPFCARSSCHPRGLLCKSNRVCAVRMQISHGTEHEQWVFGISFSERKPHHQTVVRCVSCTHRVLRRGRYTSSSVGRLRCAFCASEIWLWLASVSFPGVFGAVSTITSSFSGRARLSPVHGS